MNFDFRFYFRLFLRRIHYFLLVALPCASFGILLAYTLPPLYRAESRLLVESPQIPTDLANSTVRAGAPEMLRVIEQRLLTRANLLDLSRRFQLHSDRPGMSPDAIVADLRSRINLRLPGSRDAASFVIVSFEASSAPVTAQMVNELVTQILQQNIELRTSATGQTLEFFEQEVVRLDGELARQAAQIVSFKEGNKDALPDSLAFRRARQAAQQERVLQMERELSSLRDRRTRLVEIYERTGQVEAVTEARTPEQQRLQQLKNELASALVIYSPENPRVRNLQAQIDALEQRIASEAGPVAPGSAPMTVYELQLADIDGQIGFITEQKSLIEAELQALATTINETPSNSIALDTLERTYNNIQTQYNQAVARLAQAKTGDRIEVSARGQRVTVIEQAVVPSEPAKPNRRLIALASVVGGIAAGLGLVFLIEMSNSAVRRPLDIAVGLGTPAFGVIPYFRTRRQAMFRRLIIWGVLLTVAVGLPVVVYLLHLYYLPIDMLIDRAVEKTGLSRLISALGLSQE